MARVTNSVKCDFLQSTQHNLPHPNTLLPRNPSSTPIFRTRPHHPTNKTHRPLSNQRVSRSLPDRPTDISTHKAHTTGQSELSSIDTNSRQNRKNRGKSRRGKKKERRGTHAELGGRTPRTTILSCHALALSPQNLLPKPQASL